MAEDVGHELLGAHRGHPFEHGAGFLQLIVAQPANDGGGLRRALLVQRERLGLLAGREVLGPHLLPQRDRGGFHG